MLGLDGRVLETIGGGGPGLADGGYEAARFRKPQGLALGDGVLYVADTGNHAVRRVDLAARSVTTIAGTGRQGQDRIGGRPAAILNLASPWDLALDGSTLYVAMAGTHQLWTIDLAAGTARAFAGNGREARMDGPLATAALAQPSGLALAGRRLVFADSESSSIRAVELDAGKVVTLAGASPIAQDLFSFGDADGRGMAAKLQHPLGVAVAPDGSIFVADSYNHRIKRLDPSTGEIVTVAGTGKPGAADGPLKEASFSEPGGLSVAGNLLYVADTNNHRVRVVDLAAGTVSRSRSRFRRPRRSCPGSPDGGYSGALSGGVMPRFGRLVLVASSLLALLALLAPVGAAGGKELTLERIFSDPPLAGRTAEEVAWLPDGSRVTLLERSGTEPNVAYSLVAVDPAGGARTTLVADKDLPSFGAGEKTVRPALRGYRWTPDGKALLLSGGTDLFLFEPGTKTTRRLTDYARSRGGAAVLARRPLPRLRARAEPVRARAGFGARDPALRRRRRESRQRAVGLALRRGAGRSGHPRLRLVARLARDRVHLARRDPGPALPARGRDERPAGRHD